MTYRQWLVGQIAAGLCADPATWRLAPQEFALKAVGLADAVIAELAR